MKLLGLSTSGLNCFHSLRLGKFVSCVVLFLALVSQGYVDAGAPTYDQTAPQLEELDHMTGVWDTRTSYKGAPDGTVLTEETSETVYWSPNRRFLISEQRAVNESSKCKLVITVWDPNTRAYKMVDISSAGEVTELSMVIEGNTKRIRYNPRIGGRLFRAQLAIEAISAVEYKFFGQFFDGEKTWIFCEGTSKKRRS